jgi:hypothetical protein
MLYQCILEAVDGGRRQNQAGLDDRVIIDGIWGGRRAARYPAQRIRHCPGRGISCLSRLRQRLAQCGDEPSRQVGDKLFNIHRLAGQ